MKTVVPMKQGDVFQARELQLCMLDPATADVLPVLPEGKLVIDVGRADQVIRSCHCLCLSRQHLCAPRKMQEVWDGEVCAFPLALPNMQHVNCRQRHLHPAKGHFAPPETDRRNPKTKATHLKAIQALARRRQQKQPLAAEADGPDEPADRPPSGSVPADRAQQRGRMAGSARNLLDAEAGGGRSRSPDSSGESAEHDAQPRHARATSGSSGSGTSSSAPSHDRGRAKRRTQLPSDSDSESDPHNARQKGAVQGHNGRGRVQQKLPAAGTIASASTGRQRQPSALASSRGHGPEDGAAHEMLLDLTLGPDSAPDHEPAAATPSSSHGSGLHDTSAAAARAEEEAAQSGEADDQQAAAAQPDHDASVQVPAHQGDSVRSQGHATSSQRPPQHGQQPRPAMQHAQMPSGGSEMSMKQP